MGIEWILIAFVLYMVCGSMTARHTYAIKQREWLAIADSEASREQRMDEITDDLKSMTHGICNLNYSELRNRGCDCLSQNKWEKLHEELKSLQDGGPVKFSPGPQWNAIMSWPVVAYNNFITPQVSHPVVRGEVLSSYDETQTQEGYTVDELSKLMVNPWEQFTREDDTLAKEIKRTWQDIHAMAKADQERLVADGDEEAFIQRYEDKVTVFDGEGNVVKTYNFDEEPILIGVGNSPKV